MQQLFAEDQADVPTNAKGPLAPFTFEEYNKRVKARMQEIPDRLAEVNSARVRTSITRASSSSTATMPMDTSLLIFSPWKQCSVGMIERNG